VSAQLIPLATFRGGQWIDLDGNLYVSREIPAGASFVCGADAGEPFISMLIPGADSSFDCKLFETRCEECGQYMQVRPPEGWTPKPVFVRCDECAAKDGETTDRSLQELIKDFRKARVQA
jgi:hypothetical protein